METMKAIASRQSCREYTKEQISENGLQTVLKAANAAPVGMGKYENVKLTVIQNPGLLAKVDAAGAAFAGKPDLRPTYGAPTVILVSTIIPENNSLSPYCNAACLVENMALAATDLGLGNVYLLGVIAALKENPGLCAELKVPKGFMPTSAIALGKAAAPLKERMLTLDRIATEYVK